MSRPARRRVARAALVLALMALAAPARAQSEPAPRHDSSAPIEVTADSLEVQRDNSLAIFRGNVIAVQGEMRLSARTLVVHYREDETGGATTISRIDATDDVFVSSPDETAQGDVGVYDVDQGTIDLTGRVVLTRGANVIRGDHLVMNLATGYSRVESGAGTQGGDQRVKSIFLPEPKE